MSADRFFVLLDWLSILVSTIAIIISIRVIRRADRLKKSRRCP